MDKIEYIANTAFGLEAVVRRELESLGYTNLRTENGRILFEAGLEAIPHLNLRLRTVDRLRIKLAEFKAESFDALFEGTRAVPWADWLSEKGAYIVSAKAHKSKLMSLSDCQSIVKKAIIEKLKQSTASSWFTEQGEKYRIEVSILKDTAILTLDTSGESLHRRGYRDRRGIAPLRETLAAALLDLSYWNPSRVLADPFCGSGTILIEAALKAQNAAPGLNRTFDSESWPVIPKKWWQDSRNRAYDELIEPEVQLIGTDVDPAILKTARRNARAAFVDELIHFQEQDYRDWRSAAKYGVMITNPPYGEWLGDRKEAEEIYRNMARLLTDYPTWSHYFLTSNKGFEGLIGREADRRRKLYNGTLEVHYYQYYGPRPPERRQAGS